MKMRNMLGLTILAVALAASGPALAKSFTLTGTHSREEVGGACGKDFKPDSNGYYGCEKSCKGGKCSVWCKSNGVCTGTVPGKALTGRPGLAGTLKGSTSAAWE